MWQVIERLPDGREREVGEPQASLADACAIYDTVKWAGVIRLI